ncbi:MAG: hypothetical protein R2734_10325 [Nocardioides sp.]
MAAAERAFNHRFFLDDQGLQRDFAGLGTYVASPPAPVWRWARCWERCSGAGHSSRWSPPSWARRWPPG